MAEIDVQPLASGRFRVRVVTGTGEHGYEVRVPADLAERMGAEPAEVARATFAFLLDREPPTSILPSFDCTVVSRYFPEYESALPGYLRPASA